MTDEKLMNEVMKEVSRRLQLMTAASAEEHGASVQKASGGDEGFSVQRPSHGDDGLIARTVPLSDPMEAGEERLVDIAEVSYKQGILMAGVEDPEALLMMRRKTPARIGMGSAGPRLKTKALLSMRADHASAMDAVWKDVDEKEMEGAGLFCVKTLCQDRNEHLTRPDLGRQFSRETCAEIESRCQSRPRVQIYVADGLSSQAVLENAPNMLPAMIDGLKSHGIEAGTPFFVKFGRVPAMDMVSELLEAEVTCVLIGERPGLAAADSMSAYIAYRATVGMPEARRTVISNIHKNGIPAVEAGAYAADVIRTILEQKQSGVELKR